LKKANAAPKLLRRRNPFYRLFKLLTLLQFYDIENAF